MPIAIVSALPSTLRDLLPPDLHGTAQPRVAKRGDSLFSQHHKPTHLFYVATGEVALQRPGIQGRSTVLQRVQQGFVAEASLQTHAYHCDAVMTSDGTLISIPIDGLRSSLLQDPAFAMRWIDMLNRELKRLRTQCERLSLVGVKERVLHLIETEGQLGRLVLNSSVKSIAAEIGVTHEALYRTLAAMEKQGQLTRSEGELRIGRRAIS